MRGNPVKKVTISVPRDLLSYADRKATERASSRSALICSLLSEMRSSELERLGREGYEFYANESADFATASSTATAEAFGDDRSTR